MSNLNSSRSSLTHVKQIMMPKMSFNELEANQLCKVMLEKVKLARTDSVKKIEKIVQVFTERSYDSFDEQKQAFEIERE